MFFRSLLQWTGALAIGFMPVLCIPASAANLEELSVVQVGERLHDGRPSIAITFSDKLDPLRSYDSYLEVTSRNKIIVGGWVLDDNRQTLYFPGVEPQTRYALSVRAGLSAANGKELGRNHRQELSTRALRPSAGFASSGSVLPAGSGAGLPIRSVNVEAVDVEFLRVHDDQVQQFARYVASGASLESYQLNGMGRFFESVYMARFATHGERNRQTITNIAVEEIAQLQRPGLYIAVLRVPATFSYRQRISLFFISDVGLHVRRYRNSLEIFASSLDTGHALAEVQIEIRDSSGTSIGSTVTDEDGRAAMRVDTHRGKLLTGTQGKHSSFVYLDGAALDLSEYDLAGRAQRPLDIFVYSPRNLYRPGETIEFSALLRTGDGGVAPALPIEARLKRADGRDAGRFTWQPGKLGYYAHSFALPGDSPAGQWSLEVRTDPADPEPGNVYRFLVEEFLPERMKLELETATEWLEQNQRFAVNVTGSYLYGAPAAENRFSAMLHLRQNRHPVESLEDFYFGEDDGFKASKREITDTTLDAEGKYALDLAPLSEVSRSPVKVSILANLFETGGRPVTRSIARTVWPAGQLIGVRPLFAENGPDYNSAAAFEILLSNPDGELLAGKELELTLVRESREYFWEYDPNGGWRHHYSQSNYPVHRQNLDIAAGHRARLSVPVEWGRYRLEVSDPETGLMTTYRFHAGWHYWRTRSAQQAGTRPDQVTLSFDKPSYREGDVAKLRIDPPHAGDAIVLVEDESLRWAKRLAVPADGISIEIPVSFDWNRHDLYVSAVVLRPASKEQRESPNRALGIVHLPIDRAHRRLEVNLDLPERMEPERDLSVDVRIPGLAGTAASVTVAAVDVGVLNITNFETPNPFDFFFAQRGYAPGQFDLYSRVIERLSGARATLRYGGDAAPMALRSGSRPMAMVKIVSLFSGPVDLDTDGRATVSLPVPDFNGRLRVMAVAFSDNRFGAAEQELIVRAPLVSEIAMPRFLASGDQSALTLDLHNLSGRTQRFNLLLNASAPLELETVSRELMLDDGEKVTLRYPLAAALDLGVGRVLLSVGNDAISVERSWELAVRPPFPDEARTQRGTVNPGERIFMPASLASELMPNTVKVDVDISPLPPLGLKDALANLLRYPYGCAEQTTSSAFPLIYADAETQARFGLERLSDGERTQRVDKAFVRLTAMQSASGGFGLWRSDSPEDPWLTAYVSHFLVEAAERGFDAPAEVRQNALARLHRLLQSGDGFSLGGSSYPGYTFAAKAYAAYVLARVNRAPVSTLRNLFDNHRQEARSGLPLVQLGIALELAGDLRRAAEAVREGIEHNRDRSGYYGDYGTRLRDAAAILYLVHRHGVDVSGQAGRLVFKVAYELNTRRHFSTQERNNLFLAGLVLPEQGKSWSGRMRAGAREILLNDSGGNSTRLSMDDLERGISFESEADFPLYYTAIVSGYRSTPPASDAHHFHIRRRLLNLDGDIVTDRDLEVGELLLVHSSVESARDVRDGLFVDFLPPGFELENQNLAHTPKLAQLRIDGTTMTRLLANEHVRHTEYRDDRFVSAIAFNYQRNTSVLYLVRVVTPGRYRWPAPIVEDMYRPEIRSTGADHRDIVIVDRPR
jgi:alpha-2-macroglobulin